MIDIPIYIVFVIVRIRKFLFILDKRGEMLWEFSLKTNYIGVAYTSGCGLL